MLKIRIGISLIQVSSCNDIMQNHSKVEIQVEKRLFCSNNNA